MKHIEINIWKACNNKCRFCMSAEVWMDEKKLTDTNLVIKEIEKYSMKWFTSIGFLWWDISIHPWIFEILNSAKNNNFKEISVITNAMVFDDHDKALKLIKSWVTRVNISIHSYKSKVEDYLTQVNWWLLRKLKAIDNFNDLHNKGILKSALAINIVLNWKNYKDIIETCIYFYKEKNIYDMRLNFIWPRYFTSKKDREDLFLKYSDFLSYIKKLIYLSLKLNIRITFDSIPACIFYKIDNKNYKKLVSKFLWESFDKIEEISNINKNLVFDWKKQKKDDLKVKFESCNKCIYNKVCEWVRKEYVEKCWSGEFIAIKNEKWIT